MKKIKENLKLIIGIFIGVVISSTTLVYAASYLSRDILFTSTNPNWKAENVETALNDLYTISTVEYSMPTGTVISYMGKSAPAGYLTCDGTVYNISDYQALADHIKTQFGSSNYFGGDGKTTFAVPDLRGEFLRGTGTNSHANQGSGANVGEHQDATVMPFMSFNNNVGGMDGMSLTVEDSSFAQGYNRAFKNPDFLIDVANIGTRRNFYFKYDSSWLDDVAITYQTTRPTNTSVLYVIKF